MKQSNKTIKILTFFTLLFVLQSCEKIISGTHLETKKVKNLLSELTPEHSSWVKKDGKKTTQVSTKISLKEVVSRIGTPTFIKVPTGDEIFYAQEIGYSFLFVRNMRVKQRIIGFKFNNDGNLVEINEYNDIKLITKDMESIKVTLEKPNPNWALPLSRII